MADRKIIQIAVNESGTTCLTDDGRVWYWMQEGLWDGPDYRLVEVWKELRGEFREDPSVASTAETTGATE